MMAHGYARRLSPSAVFAAMLVAATTSAQASVEISTKPTHNMSCSGGVCAPTAKNADLNATDLANMLATSDVKVVTGGGAVTITVSSSFSWTSTHRLTLDAYYNVSFSAPAVVAGQGAVTIVTNDGGTGGDLIFFAGGKLDFWDTTSSLIINGTPYVLASNIQALAAAVKAKPSKSLALTKDYDASIDGTYPTSPIPVTLAGNFSGLGHTISNVTINGSVPQLHAGKKLPWSNVGFLEFVDYLGSVSNLRLVHEVISISGRHVYVGGLVGENGGLVDQCSVDVEINAPKGIAGGLVGLNYYFITNSTASVKIASGGAGGIAGNNQAEITDTFASGSAAGGIVGGIAGGTQGDIEHSSASVNVSGIGHRNAEYAGGLAGYNVERITTSHATGTVDGEYAGGLVGLNRDGTITQSYATGTVFGTLNVGGLVGLNGGPVSNSYASGSVTGQIGAIVGGGIGVEAAGPYYSPSVSASYSTGAVAGGDTIGGLVGQDTTDQQTITDAYWDTSTSGISNASQGAGSPANDPGIAGLTDQQLISGLPTGFDPAIWGHKKKINNGYPYLLANPPAP